MYSHHDGFVEECCYDTHHLMKVREEIEKNFNPYFDKFIETDGGSLLSGAEFEKLKKRFKVCDTKSGKENHKSNFKTLLVEAYEYFEKDRQKYIDIFDEESLEEAEDDSAAFKYKTLKNDCPIIHSTLFNKRAKDLDKYRYEFSIAAPDNLLSVVSNLSRFAREYMEEFYNEENYDEPIYYYDDLELGDIDTEDYTVYGVIGGGIKSHMLYKVYPSAFPNRSRNALWALWYLSGKKTFGCEMDSEFLMIDVAKSITQQNYFYPYELFSFYAFHIYALLKEKAEELGVYIDPRYRYVAVNRFLDFIAKEHDDEISFLKSQIKDGGFGYA